MSVRFRNGILKQKSMWNTKTKNGFILENNV